MNKSVVIETKEVSPGKQRNATKSVRFRKMLDDHKMVHGYLDGRISKKELDSKGIRFVKPL